MSRFISKPSRATDTAEGANPLRRMTSSMGETLLVRLAVEGKLGQQRPLGGDALEEFGILRRKNQVDRMSAIYRKTGLCISLL